MKKIQFILLSIILLLFFTCEMGSLTNPVPDNDEKIIREEIESERNNDYWGAQLQVPDEIRAFNESITQEWLSQDGANPLLDTHFKSSPNIKWYWGGCITLMGVNSRTKEILLIDGYVSKSADGLNNYFLNARGFIQVERYASFITSFLKKGYSIKGLLVTHGHADHMGDIPMLIANLRVKNNNFTYFPIIADVETYVNHKKILNLPDGTHPFSSLVTDLIIYESPRGEYLKPGSVASAFNKDNKNRESLLSQLSTKGKPFSSRFRVYNLEKKDYIIKPGVNQLTLGSFKINSYLMDHAAVPGISDNFRVNAFKIRGAEETDSSEVLIIDSTNEPDFITEYIYTDHLFFTWIPTFFTQGTPDRAMGHNREKTVMAVKNRIRFNTEGVHYVVPLHTDDIMANTYDREAATSSALWSKAGYWKLTGFLKWKWISYYEPRYPYSIPSVMMHDNEFKKRSFPEFSEFKRFYNPNPPRIDLLRHRSQTAPGESPKTYYYAPQGPDYIIRLANIDKRMGIEY